MTDANEAVIDKQGQWICGHAPACSVAAAERYVQTARRPSSPEEQPSEGATTKKEG